MTPFIWPGWAGCSSAFGRRSESRQVLEKAVLRAADNIPDQRTTRPNILIQSGDMEHAAQVLQGVNAFKAREALAGMYMLRGDLPAAENELRRLIKRRTRSVTRPRMATSSSRKISAKWS